MGEPLDGAMRRIMARIDAGSASANETKGTVTVQRRDGSWSPIIGYCLWAIADAGRSVMAYAPPTPAF